MSLVCPVIDCPLHALSMFSFILPFYSFTRHRIIVTIRLIFDEHKAWRYSPNPPTFFQRVPPSSWISLSARTFLFRKPFHDNFCSVIWSSPLAPCKPRRTSRRQPQSAWIPPSWMLTFTVWVTPRRENFSFHSWISKSIVQYHKRYFDSNASSVSNRLM